MDTQDQKDTQEQAQGQQPEQPQDPWIVRAEELKGQMEVLLQAQLEEYELMNTKLEQWKQNPHEGQWLTVADYEPWQAALKNLEAAHRAFDEHISTRVKK
ncbi:hypothetical protein Herbaro_07120 [Herbaspirillum sp. WKF16]|uniref:hypothetical protein n=1 Tax=Herbaspirillum sp. WKF16 TaxID=3028312 RepID=UPI0023A98C6B|nr:hypothetical protein [Herbaspirillum sp. WKF16]WDZ97555.1 hypothetical protein Herbaro_07120 [Herbaspirillum sp. WKF16]